MFEQQTGSMRAVDPESSIVMEGSLIADLESWESRCFDEDAEAYVRHVNSQYDRLAGHAAADQLVQLRLMRSLWAKRVLSALLQRTEQGLSAPAEYQRLLGLLPRLRTLVPGACVGLLLNQQERFGDRHTALTLARILAEHADPSIEPSILTKLDPSGNAITLRGPAALREMRPSRGSSRLDPIAWLKNRDMSRVEFVDGNPDHVRIRGIELRSGDIGIVELEHPGDGIFDSFLQQPGLAPHAMLYVSRRIASAGSSSPLIQPSLIEVYEGGWRTVPLTTGLSPRFSWYSEWVRPPGLPADVGKRLSIQLDEMETIAFDFQSRRIPRGGRFPAAWGQPSASCTNLIRIPFERAGVELPYPTTEIDPGAIRNLDILGLENIGPIHTPTNILNDSGFEKIGIVDNGFPELAYAQAMVIGRPHLSDTFGGRFCQRPLNLKNLPNWKSVTHWKSARTALLVAIGQSASIVGNITRFAAGYTAEEIPRTASPTAIAFYLRSDMEAGHILKTVVHPELEQWFARGGSSRLSALQTDEFFSELIHRGICNSALDKESWYGV